MTARDLLLEFLSWGYKTPTPLRAGAKRRAAREYQKRERITALYAATPNHPPSRQVKRREARA